MSTIYQQPDALSFSQNLKKFSIYSESNEVVFELWQGAVQILSEKYQPDATHLLYIDIKDVVDRLLQVTIPGSDLIVTEQTLAVSDFTARIDAGPAIPIRIIKGGVFELQEMATSFLAAHFLSWQPQEKLILQTAPEWLGLYAISAGTIKLKAYYADNTSYQGNYATLAASKLYSINTSWGSVSAWLLGLSQNTQVVAWDVWYEVGGVRKTPVQRYQLRNAGDEEHIFVWANTLAGIDSVSFTGAAEDDQKLEHKTALYNDDSIGEYDIEKLREVKQSTGFLSMEENAWLKDFFVSLKKYVVREDGSLKQIAVTSSKVITSSQIDEVDYEFTYRFGEDSLLLNIERTHTALPAPEGLDRFFLAELLSGLTSALYVDNLIMAVQSPFAQGWQKLSFAQLWGGAMPTLVDNTTIAFINGKLKVLISTGGGTGISWEELKAYVEGLLAENVIADTRTELISGAILWVVNLTYQSTNIVYKIIGVKYLAPAKELTLEPAHPTLWRIDIFYGDTFSNIQVATGIPSENPSPPILSSTQLAIMMVLIGPGATTPTGLDVEKVYDDNVDNVEWTTAETHDEHMNVDLVSVQQPLTGTKRIAVTIDVPDTAVAAPLHYAGKKYGGGTIIKLDATGKTGIICAEYDTATDVFYSNLSGSSSYTTGATNAEIGAGQANTNLMLANDAAKDDAAKYCNDLIVETFSDWYLGSEGDMALVYLNKFKIGNLGTKTYWSSTESAWNKARCISFGNGASYTRDKNNRYCVRALRSFDDNTLTNNQPVASFAPKNTKMTFSASEQFAVKDGVLSLNIKSSLPWLHNSILLIESFLGATNTGSVAISPMSNLHGYQPEQDNWQLVALQMSKFGCSRDKIDGIRISLVGSWPNHIDLGIDDIRYQHTEVNATVDTSTHEIGKRLVEAPNGELKIFSTPKPYKPGTTTVYAQGIKQSVKIDYLEADGKIVFMETPETGEVLTCDYYTL